MAWNYRVECEIMINHIYLFNQMNFKYLFVYTIYMALALTYTWFHANIDDIPSIFSRIRNPNALRSKRACQRYMSHNALYYVLFYILRYSHFHHLLVLFEHDSCFILITHLQPYAFPYLYGPGKVFNAAVGVVSWDFHLCTYPNYFGQRLLKLQSLFITKSLVYLKF